MSGSKELKKINSTRTSFSAEPSSATTNKSQSTFMFGRYRLLAQSDIELNLFPPDHTSRIVTVLVICHKILSSTEGRRFYKFMRHPISPKLWQKVYKCADPTEPFLLNFLP